MSKRYSHEKALALGLIVDCRRPLQQPVTVSGTYQCEAAHWHHVAWNAGQLTVSPFGYLPAFAHALQVAEAAAQEHFNPGEPGWDAVQATVLDHYGFTVVLEEAKALEPPSRYEANTREGHLRRLRTSIPTSAEREIAVRVCRWLSDMAHFFPEDFSEAASHTLAEAANLCDGEEKEAYDRALLNHRWGADAADSQSPHRVAGGTMYYTPENTTGYTQDELNALNEELAERLVGIEPYTEQWHEITQQHADEVARR